MQETPQIDNTLSIYSTTACHFNSLNWGLHRLHGGPYAAAWLPEAAKRLLRSSLVLHVVPAPENPPIISARDPSLTPENRANEKRGTPQ